MRKILGALTIVAVVVAASPVGAALTTDDHNDHVRAVVLFVGDSNETFGANRIVWTLTWNDHNDNGYIPVMASRVGAGIRTPDCLDPTSCSTNDYWQVKLGELGARVQPDVIVNNLGINDTESPGTQTTLGYANYSKKIDWFMSLVPPTTPVLWTNLPCSIEPADRASGCASVNALAGARAETLVEPCGRRLGVRRPVAPRVHDHGPRLDPSRQRRSAGVGRRGGGRAGCEVPVMRRRVICLAGWTRPRCASDPPRTPASRCDSGESFEAEPACHQSFFLAAYEGLGPVHETTVA